MDWCLTYHLTACSLLGQLALYLPTKEVSPAHPSSSPLLCFSFLTGTSILCRQSTRDRVRNQIVEEKIVRERGAFIRSISGKLRIYELASSFHDGLKSERQAFSRRFFFVLTSRKEQPLRIVPPTSTVYSSSGFEGTTLNPCLI